MDEDGNSYALRKHLEREEEEDAIAEMKQIGADEKPLEDQALALIEEGIIYAVITQVLASSDEFRAALLTDSGKASEMIEDEILKHSKAYDEAK